MIQLTRDRTDGTGAPILPPATWFKLAKCATTTALAEKENHQAAGTVYGHDHLRAVLEELFFFKCVYCEKDLDEEWDVEHYRPKGRVSERGDHPGYYWLAYDWDNLFPACKHCNQKRKDKAIWGDLTAGPSAGKLDQFPLEDEAARAMKPGDPLAAERPLLFHPVLDDPEPFLGFDPSGDTFAIADNERSMATIGICHLRRRRLRTKRRTLIVRVTETLKLIRDADKPSIPAHVVQGLRALLDETFLAPNCEFAGTARYVNQHPEQFGV